MLSGYLVKPVPLHEQVQGDLLPIRRVLGEYESFVNLPESP